MPFERLWRRVRALVTRDRFDADLEEEMRLHVDMRARRLEAAGHDADDARREAQARFGHPTRHVERSRDAWGLRGVEAVLQDVHYAVRLLARNPGFSAVAIIALALGIGATTAIFSVVDAVLLRPLPFGDPARLVALWEDGSSFGFPKNTPAPGNYADWTHVSALSGAAALDTRDFNLTGDGRPEKVGGAGATATFFQVMGVSPALGRAFTAAEDAPGTPARVAVIGHGLWIRRFGGDRNILGRSVLMNGQQYSIVGVMPPRFAYPFREIEIWVPIGFTGEELSNRGGHYLWVVGRLAPGRTVADLNAELRTLANRLAHDFPQTNDHIGMYAVSLLDDYVGDLGTALIVLLAAVGVVLVITAANLANLLLARATGRTREMAVRAAIGAGGGRIVRQMIVENLVLAVLGALAGLVVAWAGFGVLGTLVPENLRDVSVLRIGWRVMGFALLVAVVTGVIVGLVPARQVTRTDLVSALKQATAGSRGARHPLRSALVVTEIAGAMILVVAAGLMIESFAALQRVNLGFRADQLLTLRTPLPQGAYDDFARRVSFAERVLDKVRAIPGVTSAAYTSALPLVWKGGTMGFYPEGTERPDPTLAYDANNRVVTPGFIETMGMTLAGGRTFDARDSASAPPVVIVNEAMAKQYWPSGHALGRRLKLGGPKEDVPWRTIVGVVHDVKSMGVDQPSRPEMYFPLEQSQGNWMWPRDLVVRADGDPLALTGAIRDAIWAVDPGQPVSDVNTMDAVVDKEVVQRRTQMRLLGAFASLALILSCLGVYGVLSLVVSERTEEIGLRMALGAAPASVLRLVVGDGVRLAVVGVVIGLAGAWWATRFLQGLLYGVQPHEPWLYAGLAAVLLAVSIVAVYLPARRASQVDPIIALRVQ
jgi:putative ABC transport system permease protein